MGCRIEDDCVSCEYCVNCGRREIEVHFCDKCDEYADMWNPLYVTDNGEEFTDIDGMERSCTKPGEKRTKIFFCEPNRSDQKGSAERNHKMLRRIIPKYTNWKDSRNRSIQELVQSDMVLATNHVNSYPRPKMKNIRPYDLAFKALPEDFFVHLGLEMIPEGEVNLSPELIFNKAS